MNLLQMIENNNLEESTITFIAENIKAIIAHGRRLDDKEVSKNLEEKKILNLSSFPKHTVNSLIEKLWKVRHLITNPFLLSSLKYKQRDGNAFIDDLGNIVIEGDKSELIEGSFISISNSKNITCAIDENYNFYEFHGLENKNNVLFETVISAETDNFGIFKLNSESILKIKKNDIIQNFHGEYLFIEKNNEVVACYEKNKNVVMFDSFPSFYTIFPDINGKSIDPFENTEFPRILNITGISSLEFSRKRRFIIEEPEEILEFNSYEEDSFSTPQGKKTRVETPDAPLPRRITSVYIR